MGKEIKISLWFLSFLTVFGLSTSLVFFSDMPSVLEAKAELSTEEANGLLDEMEHLPLAAYNYLYQENYLPENGDKIYLPFKKSDEPLSVNASSALAVDFDSGRVLWEKSADEKRPIASITKLMSALVFLDNVPEWDEVYKVKKSDYRSGGKAYVYDGDELRVGDLFNLILVASDNTAVISLAAHYGMSEEQMATKMNQKAKDLGLSNTYFQDATGLSSGNVSTVKDVAALAKKALVRKDIRETVLKDKYEFKTLAGRKVLAYSTDDLLKNTEDRSRLMGGKTGYTSEAGYCFVAGFFGAEGHNVISVVFGTPSAQARFREAKSIADWSFANFTWRIAN